MKGIFYLLAFFSAFLTSCHKEIIYNEVLDDGNINLTVGEVQTRGEVITTQNLNSMAVSIFTHNDEGSDFIVNDIDHNDLKHSLTKVTRPDGSSSNRGWIFENPEHGKWDKTKTYHSFWAFAPADHDFSVNATYHYDAESDYHPRLVLTNLPDDITQQKDILYSEKKNTMHYYLGNKSVPLDFRHILSRITFQFTATDLASGEHVKISSVQLKSIFHTVTINPSQNSYSEWSGDRKKNFVIPYADVSINSSVSPLADKTNTCFMCPQKQLNTSDTKIVVTYKYRSIGMIAEEVRTLELNFPVDSKWDIGKAYNYIITDPHKPSATISVTNPEWTDKTIEDNITGNYLKFPKKVFDNSDLDISDPSYPRLSIPIDSDYDIFDILVEHDPDVDASYYQISVGQDSEGHLNGLVINFLRPLAQLKNNRVRLKCSNKNGTYTFFDFNLNLKMYSYSTHPLRWVTANGMPINPEHGAHPDSDGFMFNSNERQRYINLGINLGDLDDYTVEVTCANGEYNTEDVGSINYHDGTTTSTGTTYILTFGKDNATPTHWITKQLNGVVSVVPDGNGVNTVPVFANKYLRIYNKKTGALIIEVVQAAPYYIGRYDANGYITTMTSGTHMCVASYNGYEFTKLWSLGSELIHQTPSRGSYFVWENANNYATHWSGDGLTSTPTGWRLPKAGTLTSTNDELSMMSTVLFADTHNHGGRVAAEYQWWNGTTIPDWGNSQESISKRVNFLPLSGLIRVPNTTGGFYFSSTKSSSTQALYSHIYNTSKTKGPLDITEGASVRLVRAVR